MGDETLALIRGTVDVLILQALSGAAKHGYAVAEWIHGATDGTLLLEEGTLYPALHRLEARGWIAAEWALSDNNRKAKYYRLTRTGRTRLERERLTWREYSKAVSKALAIRQSGS